MTPELYRLFLIAQMHDDGLSQATIDFFLAVLPEMKIYYRLTAADMGRIASMTRTSAREHIKVLTDARYFTRLGYRGWKLNEPLLKNPDLVAAVNNLTS